MVKIILLFFPFGLLTTSLFAYQFDVSIAMVFQDEGPYLKEWIEFHKLVGVEHFYLYNNNSSDNFREILNPYVKEGIVDLIEWTEVAHSQHEWQLIQRGAMLDATLRAKRISKWVAFIDADEFIFPVKEKTLTEFLKDYDDCKALAANWQVFGTSNINHLKKTQLMIEQLIYKTNKKHHYNYFVKSIVQPEFVDTNINLEEWNAHMLPLIKGYHTVNANKQPLKTVTMMNPTVLIDKIRINHYTFRDEHFFFNTKLKRADADPLKTRMLIAYSKAANQVQDTSILIYAEDLRKAVFN